MFSMREIKNAKFFLLLVYLCMACFFKPTSRHGQVFSCLGRFFSCTGNAFSCSGNMSKNHQFLCSQQPGPSSQTPLALPVKTDWNKCVLCQEETSEALQCPAKSKRLDIGAGYSTLSANITRFSELNQLPLPINLSRLDEGYGIETTFKEHGAKWHKSCHTKSNATKLRRAEKRQLSPEDSSDRSPPSQKIRLSRSTEPAAVKESCYFCEGTSKPLSAVSTYNVDARVRKSASALQDVKLLAKLSAGDMMSQDAKYHPLCLASLYKRAKALDSKQDDSNRINHR